MQVFDASSIIYAWDNYPEGQFPGLWKWMAIQIEEETLVMPDVAFEQVEKEAPDCGEWLSDNNLKQLTTSNAIMQEANRIKGLLGILNDKYHSKGVDEKDIIIIATARINGAELVSDEGRQVALPQIPSKRKIPAVCGMDGVSVVCINFIDYIKRSEAVFR
jgi:hypothetical protein